MKETFSRQEWVEYTSGVVAEDLKLSMDRHIRRCEECSGIVRRFEEIEHELVEAVAILRESVPVSEWSGERAYEALRREGLPERADLLAERILRLQLFLTPICGFGTVQRAMLAAAGQAAADSVERLTEREWPAFVGHLSSIVGALCGEPSGRLLWHLGLS